MKAVLAFLLGDIRAEQVVPRDGAAVRLTWFTAGAMAFLAVFALALSLATGRLADHWSDALARTATIRISAPADQIAAQTRAALTVLETTPGIETARALSDAEQSDLLAPWFGPDLPMDALPFPRLIEITEAERGFDAEGLRLRLTAEAPGAVLDDHSAWRRPLVSGALRVRTLGIVSILLITAATAALIVLAATAALAANRQVLDVLRLVGARDAYIVRAFVRRFTLRAMGGAAIGTVAAMVAVAFLPREAPGGFLTGLGFAGAEWLLPLLVPLLAGLVAFFATRHAAFRMLKDLP